MSLTHPNHAVTEQRLSEFYQAIMPYLNGEPQKIVYGIRIDNSESVPSAKVTYLEDAIGMIPAYMDYTNNTFNYGSWEDAFFMPKPCMLKYDGTVDYYLDPNDYTKKEDGVTASDVANTSYGGNAMMEWPKIWLKIVPDATASNKSADIYIANYKADADFTDWSYHNSAGESMDHFYTAIYNGSLISSKLRSLSGQQVNSNIDAQQEYDYAQANNTSGSLIWTSENIADITLINILLILISKSTNSQAKFGQGLTVSGSEQIVTGFRTGVHNTKGLFYGTNSGTASTYANAVKVFGMENWWGLQWRRYVGEIVVSGVRKRKLTYGTEDGSTTTGYNFTGDGYINCNVSAPSGTNNTYLYSVIYSNYGMFPSVASSSSSSSTYYSDIFYYDNTKTITPWRGGSPSSEQKCGIFCTYFGSTYSDYGYAIGTSISAKPLQ